MNDKGITTPPMQQAIWKNRHLLTHLLRKELTDQYAVSLLGLGWTILQPLALLGLYSFVFSIVLKTGTGPEFQGVPFAFWLLCGLVPWTFFTDSLLRACRSITGNVSLVTKSMMDKRMLPISAMLGAFLGHIISLTLLLIIAPFFGVSPGWGWLGLLAILPSMLLYCTSWAFLLAALNVYSRDVEQLLSVFLQFLFFLTPIAYPMGMAPEWAKKLLALNPHYYFIAIYREAILHNKLPDPIFLLSLTLLTGAFFVFSHRVFQKLSSDFADSL